MKIYALYYPDNISPFGKRARNTSVQEMSGFESLLSRLCPTTVACREIRDIS